VGKEARMLGGCCRWKTEHRHVGCFDDEKQAAIERDKEAIRILGDEAMLNFHPRTGEEIFGLRSRDLGESDRHRAKKQTLEAISKKMRR
jgi:hypothetical protein